MDTQIETIRAALRDGASPEAMQQGALVCRAVLAVLDAKLAAPSPEPTSAASAPSPPAADASTSSAAGAATTATGAAAPNAAAPNVATPNAVTPNAATPNVAAIAASLRGLPREQVLDVALHYLRSLLPPGVTLPTSTPMAIPLVPIQHLRPNK